MAREKEKFEKPAADTNHCARINLGLFRRQTERSQERDLHQSAIWTKKNVESTDSCYAKPISVKSKLREPNPRRHRHLSIRSTHPHETPERQLKQRSSAYIHRI